jgi:hypothetical protein
VYVVIIHLPRTQWRPSSVVNRDQTPLSIPALVLEDLTSQAILSHSSWPTTIAGSMHSASSTSRHGPPPTFNSKNQYTSTSSSTPLSPAPTTTSSAGYSAYGYGGAPSAVAGPSGTSGSTVGVAPSTAASAARTRMQGLTEEGERARRQPSNDLGRPGGSKESKETSRMHYMALRRFLQSWLQNGKFSAAPLRDDGRVVC